MSDLNAPAVLDKGTLVPIGSAVSILLALGAIAYGAASRLDMIETQQRLLRRDLRMWVVTAQALNPEVQLPPFPEAE